jgi:hypothetical protein
MLNPHIERHDLQVAQLAIDVGAHLHGLDHDKLRRLECDLRRQYRDVLKNAQAFPGHPSSRRERAIAIVTEALCQAVGRIIDADLDKP